MSRGVSIVTIKVVFLNKNIQICGSSAPKSQLPDIRTNYLVFATNHTVSVRTLTVNATVVSQMNLNYTYNMFQACSMCLAVS